MIFAKNTNLVNKVKNGVSYCTLPDGITIKNNRYTIDNTSNTSIKSEIYNKISLNNLCEERWHDWFCIPDYHLGNNFYNEVPENLANTKSVGTCYIPCQFNYIPRDDIAGAIICSFTLLLSCCFIILMSIT